MAIPTEFRIVSPSKIAEAVGVPLSDLFAMAGDTSRLYKPTEIRLTKSGKERELDVPKPVFKRLLRRLHQYIQKAGWYSPAAHGGVKKRSTFTSADRHLGRNVRITRDISLCYPNVKTEALRESLKKRGFRPDVARLLSGLLTCLGRIPQGAPTSGDALNLFLWNLDLLMIEHCGQNISYTRLADDHVLSGDNQREVEAAAEFLESLLHAHGLSINEKKKGDDGLKLASQLQCVHSIAVNHPLKTSIPRDRVAQWRGFAEKYVGAAKCVSAGTLCLVAKKRQTLDGYINYCSQAGISPSKHFALLAAQGDKFVFDIFRTEGVTRSTKSNWWRNKSRTLELAERWKHLLSRKTA